jgi:hypothetical protein
LLLELLELDVGDELECLAEGASGLLPDVVAVVEGADAMVDKLRLAIPALYKRPLSIEEIWK